MKITKLTIDRLVYGKSNNKPHIIFDDDVPGFAVRVYPSGAKSFLVDYRFNGRQKRMVIGKYGVLTLDEARKRARKIITQKDDGQDPLEEKKQRNIADNVSQLCEIFLEKYSKPHKKSWKEDERRIQKHIVPSIGTLRLQSIKRTDITNLHNKLGKHHIYEANRVVALLSVIFEFGRSIGFFTETFVNPAKGIRKFKESKRDRWLKPDELPRLAKEIEACDNIYVRSALWLYLMTGLRKNELLRVKWEDIDLIRDELRVPQTKSGKVHYVPLNNMAKEVIKNIPREEGNPHLIPGKLKGQHLVNIDIPWRKIRKNAGLEDVRLHDLRRTVGSWLATSGNSLHVIAKILNHSDYTTTQKVYAHLAQNPLKQALDQYSDQISEIIKPTKAPLGDEEDGES
jgi:integrase